MVSLMPQRCYCLEVWGSVKIVRRNADLRDRSLYKKEKLLKRFGMEGGVDVWPLNKSRLIVFLFKESTFSNVDLVYINKLERSARSDLSETRRAGQVEGRTIWREHRLHWWHGFSRIEILSVLIRKIRFICVPFPCWSALSVSSVFHSPGFLTRRKPLKRFSWGEWFFRFDPLDESRG
jgi:hypothetical protein